MIRRWLRFSWIPLCLGVGWISYRAGLHSASNRTDPVVGAVNGLPISQAELNGQMQLHRSEAMLQLVQLRLLEREASRIGLTVAARPPSGAQTLAQQQQQRSQDLLRAIIVKQAGEAELEKVYQTCKDELTRYDVSLVLFKDQGEEETALDKLALGADFAQIARAYSQDEATRSHSGRVGWVTAPELQARYGAYVADQARGLADGKPGPAVEGPFGRVVLLVHARQSSREQLRDSVERVLVASRATPLLYDLNQEAVLNLP